MILELEGVKHWVHDTFPWPSLSLMGDFLGVSNEGRDVAALGQLVNVKKCWPMRRWQLFFFCQRCGNLWWNESTTCVNLLFHGYESELGVDTCGTFV